MNSPAWSAFLLAGMLVAQAYFRHETAEEEEIGKLADALYRRADWHWMQNGKAAVSQAGLRRKVFCLINGKAMTKPCSYTCWGSVRPHIRCRKKVTPRGLRPIPGKKRMTSSCFTQDHYLSINCRMHGSISGGLRFIHARARYGLLRKFQARDVRSATIRQGKSA